MSIDYTVYRDMRKHGQYNNKKIEDLSLKMSQSETISTCWHRNTCGKIVIWKMICTCIWKIMSYHLNMLQRMTWYRIHGHFHQSWKYFGYHVTISNHLPMLTQRDTGTEFLYIHIYKYVTIFNHISMLILSIRFGSKSDIFLLLNYFWHIEC